MLISNNALAHDHKLPSTQLLLKSESEAAGINFILCRSQLECLNPVGDSLL